MTNDDLEEMAHWLSANYSRPTWEVIWLIAEKWPDATAAEIGRAWLRTQEMDLKNFSISVGQDTSITPLELFDDVEGDLDAST